MSDIKLLLEQSKIFTISARDYADMKGVELSDYYPVGVERQDDDDARKKRECAWDQLEDLCESWGAEAIVDVRPVIFVQPAYSYTRPVVQYLIGTALIPKDKVGEK